MIKTFILDLANRIVIGKTGAVGLIVSLITGLGGPQPAIRVQTPDNEPTIEVSTYGAIATGTGSGRWGNAGDCLKSGGSSGNLMSWGGCVAAGGSNFGSGNVLAVSDGRYVNTFGDTMTGALTIRVTGGNKSTLGIEVENSLSGSVIRAQDTLASSGTLVWEGQGSGALLWLSDLAGYAVDFDNLKTDDYGVFSCIQGVGCLFDSDTVSSSTISDDSVGTTELDDDSNTPAAGAFVIVETGDTSFDYLSANAGTDITADLEEETHATEHNEGGADALTVESLVSSCTDAQVVGGNGAGGAECQADANTTYTAAQGLTLAGTALSLTASHSGSTIWATNALRSSGALTWEGAGSGAALYVGGTFDGVGLADCDADNQTLSWDATARRFGCGDDDNTPGSSYTAGQGLTLTSTSFSVNATLTGTLANFQTVSGSVVKAKVSLASSGSLSVDGTMSGYALTVSGVRACDTIDSNGAGVFACGTDDDVPESGDFGAGGDLDADGTITDGVIDKADLTATTDFGNISTDGSSNLTIDDDTIVEPDLSADNAASDGDFLQYDSTGTNFVWVTPHAGTDITADLEEEVTEGSLADSVIVEGDLKFVDSPADENIMTYETTTGDFEWHTCTEITGAAGLCDGGDANTTYTAGQGLTLAGTSLSLTPVHSGSTIIATTSLRSSGALTWEGAGSGASLYVGDDFEGAGLSDCDADNQTLAWDATSKRFSCGDDDSGGASGLVDHYVLASGDTMTGALLMSGSFIAVVTPDGSELASLAYTTDDADRDYGSVFLSGSGGQEIMALSVQGDDTAFFMQSPEEDAGIDSYFNSNILSYILKDEDGNTFFDVQGDADGGNGGNYFTFTGPITATTLIGTAAVRSSGALTWEGAGSGASLYVGDDFEGAGLTDCDTAGTSKLLWDATSKRFSCGTDGAGAFTQTTADARYVNTSGDTMTGALTIRVTGGVYSTLGLEVENTMSGAIIRASQSLNSSGSLVVEGLSTFNNAVSVNLSSTQQFFVTNNGSQNISFLLGSTGDFEVLNNSSEAVFSVYDDDTVVVNENGLSTGDFRIEGDNVTTMFFVDASADKIGIGTSAPDTTLDVIGTVSGAVVAANTVRASGSLVWERTASGKSLEVSQNVALRGSVCMGKTITMALCDASTSCATGSGAAWRVSNDFHNYVLSGATLDAAYAGTTNTQTVQVRNITDAVDLFSTKISFDSTERSSDTAATPAVLGASKTVTAGDILVPYTAAVQTTPAKGVSLNLTFKVPASCP